MARYAVETREHRAAVVDAIAHGGEPLGEQLAQALVLPQEEDIVRCLVVAIMALPGSGPLFLAQGSKAGASDQRL